MAALKGSLMIVSKLQLFFEATSFYNWLFKDFDTNDIIDCLSSDHFLVIFVIIWLNLGNESDFVYQWYEKMSVLFYYCSYLS